MTRNKSAVIPISKQSLPTLSRFLSLGMSNIGSMEYVLHVPLAVNMANHARIQEQPVSKTETRAPALPLRRGLR